MILHTLSMETKINKLDQSLFIRIVKDKDLEIKTKKAINVQITAKVIQMEQAVNMKLKMMRTKLLKDMIRKKISILESLKMESQLRKIILILIMAIREWIYNINLNSWLASSMLANKTQIAKTSQTSKKRMSLTDLVLSCSHRSMDCLSLPWTWPRSRETTRKSIN